MRDPLITVLVPVYNVEDYVGVCLDSILAQDYEKFELIIVDDGSTDSSQEILKRYAEMDRRIRIIRQENQGLAGARNTGIANVRGDWVAFVDSDDFVSPNYLSFMLCKAQQVEADIVVCGRALHENGLSRPYPRAAFSGKRLDSEEAVRALNSYRSFDMSMCGKLFKSNLFQGVVFPQGKTSEDQFVCYKLLLISRCTYYVDEPLYHYRLRPGSISRGSKVNIYPIEASQEQLATLKANHPSLVYAGETGCFFSQVAVYNAYTLRGREVPVDIASVVDGQTKLFLPSVLKNPDIPKVKKIQAITFCFCRPLYKQMYLSWRG